MKGRVVLQLYLHIYVTIRYEVEECITIHISYTEGTEHSNEKQLQVVVTGQKSLYLKDILCDA